MKSFFSFLFLSFCFHLAFSQADWEMKLVVPISNPAGEREIVLDRYPRFHILMTNTSTETLKLWKDWNTWGFFNLNMLWEVEGEKHTIRKKTPTAWDGDFPDFWVAMPGETIILEVDMSTGVWEGIPDLYGEKIKATLKATYENKTDGLARKFGIWVGKVESNEIEVVFN
ncbi:MAG: hypothetical protein R8P61_16370 [Bacteroidia bacterium]|nr:hypothetical protein [Bacteroidia bacterium]